MKDTTTRTLTNKIIRGKYFGLIMFEIILIVASINYSNSIIPLEKDSISLGIKNPSSFQVSNTNSLKAYERQLTKAPIGSTGISWSNLSIIDYPNHAITPKIIIDMYDRIHIFFSNQQNGQSLYHILIEDGVQFPKQTIYYQPSGQMIKCDAVSDMYGKVHLVFSWGNTIANQKTYYQTWYNGSWSDIERVDKGYNNEGGTCPAHNPIISVDKYGNPHVLWSAQIYDDYDLLSKPIYYQRRLDTNLWSGAFFTSYATIGNYRMIITEDDIVHVVISQRIGSRYIAYHRVIYLDKNILETTFGLEEEIIYEPISTSILTVPTPDLVRVNNSIHIFYQTLSTLSGGIFHGIKIGQMFDFFELITNQIGYYGIIKLSGVSSKRGDIALTWSNNDFGGGGGINYIVYSKTLDMWFQEGLITDNAVIAIEPTIICDKKDKLHLIWKDNHPVTGKAIYYTTGIFDLDNDGLSDEDEITIYNTDPYNPDTDGDQMNDGEEVARGMNPLNPDEDMDLMADGWEIMNGLNPFNASDATIDLDFDGLTSLEEFTYQTDPNDNDTDDDYLLDGDEVYIHFTSPINPDTDSDELTDWEELFNYFTDPINPDTDNDGMPDGYEIANGLNPLFDDAEDDPDNDLLLNLEEYFLGTNPHNNDTDSDLLYDYDEVYVYGTNPLSSDTDGDGLTDYYELTIDPLDFQYQTNNIYQTDPLNSDSDFDSLSDYFEIDISLTNPLNNDTDNDLMSDGFEVIYNLNPFLDDANNDEDDDGLTNLEEFLLGSNPRELDTDGDYLTDFEEFILGTDPTNPDTDGDGLTDYFEYWHFHTNPCNADEDNDNLNDYYEVIVFKTNPFNNDTDQDTLLDGDEVFIYNSNPTKKDTDDDKLLDPIEISFNSNPSLKDTDRDGMDDYFEWLYGLNPRFDDSQGDLDEDNLKNIDEYWFETNPLVADTDQDGLNDYQEVFIYLSSPIRVDTDNDLINDYDEVMIYKTSPIDPDCDDDGLLDGEEIYIYNTNPFLADSDFDGFSDYEEIKAGTNPLDPKDTPRKRLLLTILGTFSGILVGVSIYYMIPNLIVKFSKNHEKEWVQMGCKKRFDKHCELLEKNNSN